MGGAAAVLGLAYMIMATDMPIQLRVLIPAVENSVSNNAFRPQDILTSRKGPHSRSKQYRCRRTTNISRYNHSSRRG